MATMYGLARAIALLVFVITHALANVTCYYNSGSTVVAQPTDKWTPCNNSATTSGGALSCCYVGSECGEDSICHFSDSADSDKAWFIGGCTDMHYADPVCSQHCTSYNQTDIQYNSTSSLWSCCGDHECNGTVTSESFSAIAPQNWTTLSATPTPSTTQNAHKSSLSSGDIAGIVVSCVFGVGCIVAAAAIFWLRRRKTARRGKNVFGTPSDSDVPATAEQVELAEPQAVPQIEGREVVEAEGRMVVESDSRAQGVQHVNPHAAQELDAERIARVELPGSPTSDLPERHFR